MIYALLLPTGDIKIGKDSWFPNRVSMAQTYFVEDVVLLGAWPSANDAFDERQAQEICAAFHARGEMFRGDPDTITDAISLILGDPEMRRTVLRRGSGKRVPWTAARKEYQRAANARFKERGDMPKVFKNERRRTAVANGIYVDVG